jgi:hypothetical protein
MTTDITLLEQDIISDIDEREELMFWVKSLHPRYGFSERDEQLFLSYSIPIVYSIWEGFVQTSFQIYIRELNKEFTRLELNIDSVCEPIFVYHMESTFRQFKQYPNPKSDEDKPKIVKKKVDFFNALGLFYKSNTLQIHPNINTESNVGFNVLNRILNDFNLEKIPPHENNYSLKDELGKLLQIRNAVAHGQKSSIVVNREDLERAINLVKKLMPLVFERIKTGFIEKSYLK